MLTIIITILSYNTVFSFCSLYCSFKLVNVQMNIKMLFLEGNPEVTPHKSSQASWEFLQMKKFLLCFSSTLSVAYPSQIQSLEMVIPL